MTITNFSLSLQKATWIDTNSQFPLNNLPDRVPDYLAIANSIFNLFNCPVGARGKIFQPTYGSEWLYYLQEPIDTVTSNNMFIAMIQSITRWEPRIILDYSQTFVQPDTTLPGYKVQISGTTTLTKQPININFTEVLG
jgi:phage baseplate assembly protein W